MTLNCAISGETRSCALDAREKKKVPPFYAKKNSRFGWDGARKGIRTPDLLITNEPHYQLCYPG